MKYGYYLRDADQAKQIYLSEDIYMSESAEFHDSLEFIFVLEGEILANISDDSRVLSSGMICFVNSYENHFYKPLTEKTNAYVLVISREYTRTFQELYDGMYFNTFMLNTKINEEIFSLMRTWLGIKEKTYLKNYAYTNLLFAMLIDKYGLMRHKRKSSDVALKQVLMYIHEHYLEKITMQSMSKAIGYSSDYCAKILKKNLNYDFKTYVYVLRFRKARELFSDSTLQYTVKEVAAKLGFGTVSTYYRAKRILEEKGLI